MSVYFHSVGSSNLFTYEVWGFHCGKESYFGLLVGNHLPNYWCRNPEGHNTSACLVLDL